MALGWYENLPTSSEEPAVTFPRRRAHKCVPVGYCVFSSAASRKPRCVVPEATIERPFSANRGPMSRHWHGIGTPLGRCRRRLVGVYLGLPATVAAADMPVGAPPPFASALEPASSAHADKRGTTDLARSSR